MRTGAVVGVVVVVVAVGLLVRTQTSTSPSPSTEPSAAVPEGAHVVSLDDVLDFPGATGWRSVACEEPSCASAWTHDSGLRVHVLVVPVPDPRKLPELASRLQAGVVADGGRVDRIEQAGGVVRMLRPAVVDGVDSVVISYVIPAPDAHALHIVTASTPLSDQVAADERVRDLLAFAAWVRAAPTEHASR
jgi:hypothetical protein